VAYRIIYQHSAPPAGVACSGGALAAAAQAAPRLPEMPAPPRFTEPAVSRLRSLARRIIDNWIWIGPAMIVIVGIFDLACTISAFEKGWLVEMNPIANWTLEVGGSAGLAVYRFIMTAGGCILLAWGLRMYRLRRFVGSNPGRVRAVMWAGQITLIVTHVSLAAYWVAWLTV